MTDLTTIRELCRYGDWANDRLIQCASPLSEEQLDRAIPMGRGRLRTTLIHIYTGEFVWLARAKGIIEHPWPSEAEKVSPAELGKRFAAMRLEREAFFQSLSGAELSRVQSYRDSKGSLYKAALGQMMLQSCLHSHHHRAQAANMLRQLDAATPPPELDYMYSVRQPA